MVGGKRPDQIASDLAAGVARIGGFWRQPNYFESYLHASTILIDQGIRTGSLDEIGLPGFYLQRHALELLLKRLLGWLIDISDMRNGLGRVSDYQPSKGLRESLNASHNLTGLLRHLVVSSSGLNVSAPPQELVTLINDMSKIEITDTWSR